MSAMMAPRVSGCGNRRREAERRPGEMVRQFSNHCPSGTRGLMDALRTCSISCVSRHRDRGRREGVAPGGKTLTASDERFDEGRHQQLAVDPGPCGLEVVFLQAPDAHD